MVDCELHRRFAAISSLENKQCRGAGPCRLLRRPLATKSTSSSEYPNISQLAEATRYGGTHGCKQLNTLRLLIRVLDYEWWPAIAVRRRHFRCWGPEGGMESLSLGVLGVGHEEKNQALEEHQRERERRWVIHRENILVYSSIWHLFFGVAIFPCKRSWRSWVIQKVF